MKHIFLQLVQLIAQSFVLANTRNINNDSRENHQY